MKAANLTILFIAAVLFLQPPFFLKPAVCYAEEEEGDKKGADEGTSYKDASPEEKKKIEEAAAIAGVSPDQLNTKTAESILNSTSDWAQQTQPTAEQAAQAEGMARADAQMLAETQDVQPQAGPTSSMEPGAAETAMSNESTGVTKEQVAEAERKIAADDSAARAAEAGYKESSALDSIKDGASKAYDAMAKEANFVKDFWGNEIKETQALAEKGSQIPGIDDEGDRDRHQRTVSAVTSQTGAGALTGLVAPAMNDVAGLVTQPFQGVPISNAWNSFTMDLGNNASGWWEGMTGIPATSFPSSVNNVAQTSTLNAFTAHFQNLGHYLGTL